MDCPVRCNYERPGPRSRAPALRVVGTKGRTLCPHSSPRINQGKKGQYNIYSDSKYAFATLHIHGAIYRERGLLTAEGKEIKNKTEILRLLEAVWSPAQIAVMHCRGQTKGNTEEAVGNRLADQAAKAPAKKQDSPKAIVSPLISSPLSTQDYQPAEEEWTRWAQASRTSEGLWRPLDGRVYVPQGQAVQVVQNCHALTHLGKTALENLLRRYLYIPNLTALCARIAAGCVTCAKNNAAGNNPVRWEYNTEGPNLWKTCRWISLKSNQAGDITTCSFSSAPFQVGSSPSPLGLRKPGK